MWTQRTSLSLNKQMRKEALSPPPQPRPVFVRPHHGFFHSSYQSSLVCGSRENREALEERGLIGKVTRLSISRP